MDNILYIGTKSFLLNKNFELKFIKSKKKKIVFMFLGTDIRSPHLMLSLYEELEYDGFINYIASYAPAYISDSSDNKKLALARLADIYGDVIFNARVDQMSYLKSKQYFPPYICEIQNFNFDDNKFQKMQKVKILHAPSNSLIKGTPLVRAAIKKLQIEGYNFEYCELKNVSNQIVLEHLQTSHIVLNQFYAFVPGIFGIEAMANHTAVLMSADANIETALPQDSKDAWMLTRYWEVYDNLKYLLDNPEKIKYYADKGYDFSYKHYTYEKAREYVNKVLTDNGVID